jgi:hypothetical protein
MEKEQLTSNLIKLGVTPLQVNKIINEIPLNQLQDYYTFIVLKKQQPDNRIRNFPAFFMKLVKDKQDISYELDQLTKQQENKKAIIELRKQQDIISKEKKQEVDLLKDQIKKVDALCLQLTKEEKEKMLRLVDAFILKEHGPNPYAKIMFRNVELIKCFELYKWDIDIIKSRLSQKD